MVCRFLGVAGLIVLTSTALVISILLAEKYEYSIQSSVVRSKVVSLQNRHEQQYLYAPCRDRLHFLFYRRMSGP